MEIHKFTQQRSLIKSCTDFIIEIRILSRNGIKSIKLYVKLLEMCTENAKSIIYFEAFKIPGEKGFFCV